MAPRTAPGPVTVLRGHVSDVQALVFHPSLDLLYSGDITGELKSWDPAVRRPTSSLRTADGVLGIACLNHAAGTVLICQSRNGVFQFLDLLADGLLTSSTQRAAFSTGAYTFCRMAAMGSAVPSISILKAHTPEQTAAEAPESTQASAADAQSANNEPVSPVAEAQYSTGPVADAVLAAAPSPASGAVASVAGCTQSSLSAAMRAGSDDGTRTSESASATAGCSGDTIGLVACPAEDPGRVEIWGLQAGRCLEVVQPPGGDKFGMCMSLALFRRDNVAAPYLAAGYEDGRLAIWRLGPHVPAAAESSSSGSGCTSSSGGAAARLPQLQHRPLFAAKLHNEPLMALAVSAPGTGGISGSAETTAVCFEIDFQSRAVVPTSTVEMPKEGVSDVAIRGDARLWVAAGWDGRLRVHTLRKGIPLAVLKYHTAAATAVTFSHSGILASASRDGTVALWSIYR